MNNNETLKHMELLWKRINETRNGFRDFIEYEWNYMAHLTFHKNYHSKLVNVIRLVKRYLDFLRKKKRLTFAAFYIIPKSRVDPIYNPHHVHILFLVFNSNDRTAQTLLQSAERYNDILNCEAHSLYSPEAGTNYLSKNKNLNIANYENIHFDFYREQLLKEYRNDNEFINAELKRMFQERYKLR